ncbi:MAG TPA: DUF6551 family protein [Gemmatimonadales bacterium]|nr:DUF6551 family protein [Gemmatimonadales bacterium]
MSETTYTVETIPASRLKVDPRVQRDGLRFVKVTEIEKKFNPDALGVIFVSRRGSEEGEDDYIIDGWHRDEVAKRKDPNYPLTCHVFRGLTLVEEALMFLDLNTATTPTRLEKFKAKLAAEDEAAKRINEICRSRGWTVSAVPQNGNVNAVAVLERIDALSMGLEAQPHLLDATLLVISRAWGQNREGVQAVLLDGISQLLAEYNGQVNLNTLYEKLREREGGPAELHNNALQVARMEKGRTADAVSDLVIKAYNKGSRSKQLPLWGGRRRVRKSR